MTQLVKDSSWRTLRRKVVVGASSLALVAGMGVALSPVANAANNGDLTIAVAGNDDAANFPATTAAGTASKGSISIENNKGTALVPSTTKSVDGASDLDNVFQVRVVAKGAGLVTAKANGTITAFTVTPGTATAAAVDVLGGTASGSDTLEARVNADAAATAAAGIAAANDSLQLALTSASWTGKLDVTVSVIEVPGGAGNDDTDTSKIAAGTILRTLGSASFSTTVAQPGPAQVAHDKTSTASPFDLTLSGGLQTDLSAVIVKSFGVPAASAVVTTPVAGNSSTLNSKTGIYTIKDASGNVFTFDTATGVLQAAAAAVKAINVNAPAKFTVTLGAVVVNVVVNVLFKDDASIAEDLSEAVYALAAPAVGDPLINGYADGTFKPAAPVTRQAFAAFAARYLNVNAGTSLETSQYVMCSPDNPSKFKDVPNNAPFCAVIRDLAAAGVTTGYADGTFKPAEPITRRAIAAFLHRIDNLQNGLLVNTPAAVPTSAPFKDVAVNAPFAAEIAWMASGTDPITTGYKDGTFKPGANSSRQATAAFLYRMGA